MAVSSFSDLEAHVGHEVKVVRYGNRALRLNENVAVECVECHEILIDYDYEDELHAQRGKHLLQRMSDVGENDIFDDGTKDIVMTLRDDETCKVGRWLCATADPTYPDNISYAVCDTLVAARARFMAEADDDPAWMPFGFYDLDSDEDIVHAITWNVNVTIDPEAF